MAGRAVIFLREGEQLSTTAQEELCASEAASRGLRVVRGSVHVGKSLKKRYHGSWALTRRGQPELFQAISSVAKGDSLICVAPHYLDHEAFAAVSAAWVVENAQGNLVFADLAHPSVYQFKATASIFSQHHRTIENLKQMPKPDSSNRDPRHWGGGAVPYGYRLSDDTPHYLVPVEEEQKIIDLMIELRNKGLALRPIGEELARMGHKTPRGCIEWPANSISRIMKRREREALEDAKTRKKPRNASGS